MFKSKLQEYCQAKGWLLPKYSVTKEGYDHCPLFKASVLVNGATFVTPNFSKSSKDANNLVAQLAFDYLTSVSSSASPASHVSGSATCSTVQQSEPNEAMRASPASIASPTNRDDTKLKVSSSASPASLVSGSATCSTAPASHVSGSATCSTVQQSEPNEAMRASPASIASPTNRDDTKLKVSSSASPASLVSGSATCSTVPASLVSGSATCSTVQQSEPNEVVRASPASIASPTNWDDKKLKGSSSPSPASLVSATCSTVQQSELNETVRASPASIATPTNRDDKKLKDMARLFKNQLQIYAQKRNLGLPVYTSQREGPPHASRFKCKVTFEGKTYECQEYFSTVKDAENAAARIALMSVSPVGMEEEDPGFFKNLLQELAQKDYSCLPEYNTTSSGPSHAPVFISTVEIKDQSFIGLEAKTKKLAEMYAAKVAYVALKERASQKASEYKHVVVQPGAIPNIAENTYGVKVEELPFQRDPSRSPASPAHPPSSPILVKNNEPWTNSNSCIPSAHKKVIVFPRTPNMTLPPGATIKHQDEKYICVTMDSDNGNAWE